MQITAAVLRNHDGPFTIERLELGEPNADEVLVRMVSVGMCHTDLLSREVPAAAWKGPMVRGHEGAGIIQAVGSDVRKVAIGDHVVLSFNHCRRCKPCQVNRPACCYKFTPLNMLGNRPDGTTSLKDCAGKHVRSHFFGQSSFASHAVVAQSSVVKVDKELPLKILGPLGCGVQTGAGAILNTLNVQPGSSVAIYGVGALGLSAVMAAKVAGAEVIVAVDRHQSRLDLARKYGATHTASGTPDEIIAAVRAATPGKAGTDFAFDATGAAPIFKAAFMALNNLGVLGVAGIGFGPVQLDMGALVSGKVIKGVIEGDSVPEVFIPKLVQLNKEGRFPYHELITEYSLEDINEAEKACLSGQVIKPVFVLPQNSVRVKLPDFTSIRASQFRTQIK